MNIAPFLLSALLFEISYGVAALKPTLLTHTPSHIRQFLAQEVVPSVDPASLPAPSDQPLTQPTDQPDANQDAPQDQTLQQSTDETNPSNGATVNESPQTESGTSPEQQPAPQGESVEQDIGGQTEPLTTTDKENIIVPISQESAGENDQNGTPAETPSPQTEEQRVNEQNNEFAQNQTLNTATINADDTQYLNVQPISDEFVEKSKLEQGALAQAVDPESQTSLLIQYATDKADDLNTLIEKNDLGTTNFVTQRLNDQLDGIIQNLDKISETEYASTLREKAAQLNEVIDPVLRADQLIVPETLEQDLEIARGKLLFLQGNTE